MAPMLTTELVPAADGSTDRLMVVLHGLGDSMEGWRFFSEELGLPWLSTLLVNAPDAYYNGYAWYDYFGDQSVGIERSRAALTRLLMELPGRGFRLDRTVLLGFSQGCVMTLDVGLRLQERLAGMVGISGYVFEIEKLLAELAPVASTQRVLVTHGTADPLLPIAVTRDQVLRLKSKGLNVEWSEFHKAHTLDVPRELNVLRDFLTATLKA